MRPLLLFIMHVLTTIAKRADPGGTKAVIAENFLIKHQLQIAQRSRGKTPHLSTSDRFLFGFLSLFMRPQRIRKSVVTIKPATVMKFRRALTNRNYHQLFSSWRSGKPGPKGPSDELIRVIVEMKKRNLRFGSPRIAQQISKTFGIEINKDTVRRVLAKHYRPGSNDGGLRGEHLLAI